MRITKRQINDAIEEATTTMFAGSRRDYDLELLPYATVVFTNKIYVAIHYDELLYTNVITITNENINTFKDDFAVWVYKIIWDEISPDKRTEVLQFVCEFSWP